MARPLYAALLSACLLVVGGCSSNAEAPHNERYFDEHPDARADMLKRCAKDQSTENPLNCMAAENSNRSELLRQSLHGR